jgi:hypothetical protein
MVAAGRSHADRLWAVAGCSGIGRHVAQRLVAGGGPSWMSRRSWGVRPSVGFTQDGTGLLADNGQKIVMWRLREMRVTEALWKRTRPDGVAAVTTIDPTGRVLIGSAKKVT